MAGSSITRPSWLVISYLCTVSLASALQYMLLLPLLPILPGLLNTTPSAVTWLVTASIVAGTITTPIITRLADMYGRRLMTVVSLLTIAVGSIIALLSTDIWVIVGARAISGMAGGVVPVAIGIMRTELPPKHRSLGIGLVSAAGGVGVGIGLPIGGWLNEVFGWNAMFTVMFLISVALIIVLPLIIRGGGPRVPGSFDFAGAVLLTCSLGALLLAISMGNTWGWLSWPILALVVGGIASGLLWFAVERRVTTPLIDLRISSNRPIVLINLVSFFAGVTMFGNVLVMTLQVQVPADAGGLGFDPLTASLVVGVVAFVMVIAAPVAGVFVSRIGGRRLLFTGSVLTLIGYGTRFFVLDSLEWIMAASVLIQIGSAASIAAIPVIVTANAPIAQTASINGVNTLIRSVGTAIAAALLAAVVTVTRVSPSGVVYPAPEAFLVFFAIATACATACAVATLWVSNGDASSLENDEEEPARIA